MCVKGYENRTCPNICVGGTRSGDRVEQVSFCVTVGCDCSIYDLRCWCVGNSSLLPLQSLFCALLLYPERSLPLSVYYAAFFSGLLTSGVMNSQIFFFYFSRFLTSLPSSSNSSSLVRSRIYMHLVGLFIRMLLSTSLGSKQNIYFWSLPSYSTSPLTDFFFFCS
ncbi:hypothetical protein K435DRAFT_423407 [Dendrothele bispora CBS 962.96]|uniref:Uncharacterized protein n=1 Tax=Dendrothele bispora (strain CBS 962.96) TaxID=1314807 RepID=A0A4S8L567_DENBC|nr:hypothetical protein K435DRAFT_423407 [Dendrothele bispora CBS 962.96]